VTVAPDDIEAMTGFGFQHLPGDRDGPLESLGEKLQPWIEDNFVEASEGFEVLPLGAEELEAWGVTVSEDTAVLGAMVGIDYQSSLDRVLEGMTWPRQDEIFSSFLEFERQELMDRDCFLSQECAEYMVVDTVLFDVGALEIQSNYTATTRYRHVNSDEGWGVAWGFVTPDPVEFNVDYLAVNQQYGFSWLYPQSNGGTRRVHAVWIEGELIGIDLPEDFQLQMAIDGMVRSAAELDAWLQGEVTETDGE
jgi:hypothetical protein